MNINKTKESVYLSAGWFCPGWDKQETEIKKVFDKVGLSYFSPRNESLVGPDPTPEDLQKTFDQNVEFINYTDFMIVNTSGHDVNKRPDVGAIFEAGYAYAIGRPIVYIWLDEGAKEKEFNLMLKKSAMAVLYSYKELEEYLRKLIVCGFDFWELSADYDSPNVVE